MDVPAEVLAKILQRTLQRLDRTRREGAEGIPRSEKLRLKHEGFEIASTPPALLHREQDLLRPRRPTPTRRAPAAGFLREEVLKIPDHPDGTGLVVQHHHGSCPQTASRLLHI